MLRRTPGATLTDTLFPDTPLVRAVGRRQRGCGRGEHHPQRACRARPDGDLCRSRGIGGAESGFALHLLRHGAPETPGLLMGRTDGGPTEAGIAACVARAETLAVERLIASDLRRCRAAGEAIGDATGLPLTIDPRWRELDFGEWDRSEEHTSELQSLMRTSYAVFYV